MKGVRLLSQGRKCLPNEDRNHLGPEPSVMAFVARCRLVACTHHDPSST